MPKDRGWFRCTIFDCVNKSRAGFKMRTYDLEELPFHLILPPLSLHKLGHAENLFHRSRDHANRFFSLRISSMMRDGSIRLTVAHRATFHSERLARPSLTIGEDAYVITVRTALSKLRNLFKDLSLRRLWFEYLQRNVENEKHGHMEGLTRSKPKLYTSFRS